MVTKKNIAVIPARGGSKRIPRKNIIDFFGKPLIAWTIEAAIKSNIFDRILVSTDDVEIASIAKDFGIDVPFLRTEYCDDYSSISNATIAALYQAKSILNEEYQTVTQLMPNCPLRKSEHIIDAYNNFLNTGNLFQISCFKFVWMNPWWAVKIDKQWHPLPLFDEAFKERSQDLENLYCPTGAIWIADAEALKSSGTFYSKPCTFYPIDWKAAVDIDDMNDLEMAKAIFIMLTNKI